MLQIWTLTKESFSKWLVNFLASALSPQIGEHFIFNVFHQSPGIFPASHFCTEWTTKINEWVGSIYCSGGDIISPEAMK